MRYSVLVLALASVSVGSLVAREAAATQGISGYSGKPYNGTSSTCKDCHGGGGAAPTVNITLPTTMTAGEKTEVTIVVNGTRVRTSMNAAFSEPGVATSGMNTDVPFPLQTPDEVVAVAPVPNGASGTFKFSFVAPNVNGPLTMYLAAMSANGSGTGGDGVAVTTRQITISGATGGGGTDGGTTQPDGGTTPPPRDGGTGTPGDGGTGGGGGGGGGATGGGGGSGGGSSTVPNDGGAQPGDEGEDENPGVGQTSTGGCNMARGDSGSAPVIAFAAALAWLASRRRRR